jgi:hypothetical protein
MSIDDVSFVITGCSGVLWFDVTNNNGLFCDAETIYRLVMSPPVSCGDGDR